MKKLFALLLALLMCMSVGTVGFATDVQVNDAVTFEIVEDGQDPNKGHTRSNFLVVDQALSSATGSETISFNTSSDYPYYRIYVENNSKVTYNITLTNASGANQLSSSPYYLAAGYNTVLRNNNAASGMRYLTITASDGSALSGAVSIRIASNADELS